MGSRKKATASSRNFAIIPTKSRQTPVLHFAATSLSDCDTRRVKSKKKRIALIGLPVLQEVTSYATAAIARYAEKDRNWRFVFSAEASVEAFKFLRKLDCDGAIVRILNTAMLREAKKIRFPLVNISAWLENPGVPSVRYDRDIHGRMAAEYLLEKGFRRFGCVVPPGGWFIKQGHNAVVQTVRAHGGSVDSFHLKTTTPEVVQSLPESEQRRFVEWLRTFQLPGALVLLDDWDAPALMKLCVKAGFKIPRDIVIISVCCHSEVQSNCLIPLSVVQEDHDLVSTIAVRSLDELMAGRPLHDTLIDVPPVGVVERASTATMAIEDRDLAHAFEFIRCHGLEPINIADVCNSVQIARVTLERRFRKVIGTTMHKYLTRLRVNRAKELLLSELDHDLPGLARQCGFTERRHLVRAFTEEVGQAPSAWRKKNLARNPVGH